MPLFQPKVRPVNAFSAEIEVSAQRFFNPGSNDVKTSMTKEHFFELLLGF